jgi:transposase
MKVKYQELIAAGKPPKVAIIAIMRKLIVLANTLLRDGRTWTPTMA